MLIRGLRLLKPFTPSKGWWIHCIQLSTSRYLRCALLCTMAFRHFSCALQRHAETTSGWLMVTPSWARWTSSEPSMGRVAHSADLAMQDQQGWNVLSPLKIETKRVNLFTGTTGRILDLPWILLKDEEVSQGSSTHLFDLTHWLMSQWDLKLHLSWKLLRRWNWRSWKLHQPKVLHSCQLTR